LPGFALIQSSASWEGFALEQTLAIFGASQSYFWGTQRGAELDLLIFNHNKKFGFEFKCCDAPKMTKSLHIALQDLGLERLYVVYPGRSRYPLHEKEAALPLSEVSGLSMG
jgi:predicted AAA+ superfamily ATPase